MAMLNVIIGEDLYDHEFVDSWTYGFEALAERVADKTPEWAFDICGVEPETLRGAARLIATASSCACQWGLAFEQQIAALGVTESVADIMAITGNIDNPGGNALYRCAFLIEEALRRWATSTSTPRCTPRSSSRPRRASTSPT